MIVAYCQRLRPMFLMAMLVLVWPANAQTLANDGALSAPLPANPTATANETPGSCWKTEAFERQEFREEMEQIRRDHEELAAARNTWQEQCAHVSETTAAECADQKQALQDRHDKLHERVTALRERLMAARKEGGTALWQTRNQQPAAVTAEAPATSGVLSTSK